MSCKGEYISAYLSEAKDICINKIPEIFKECEACLLDKDLCDKCHVYSKLRVYLTKALILL